MATSSDRLLPGRVANFRCRPSRCLSRAVIPPTTIPVFEVGAFRPTPFSEPTMRSEHSHQWPGDAIRIEIQNLSNESDQVNSSHPPSRLSLPIFERNSD